MMISNVQCIAALITTCLLLDAGTIHQAQAQQPPSHPLLQRRVPRKGPPRRPRLAPSHHHERTTQRQRQLLGENSTTFQILIANDDNDDNLDDLDGDYEDDDSTSYSYNNYYYEDTNARLRSDLLTHYDKGSFPWHFAWETSQQPNDDNGLPHVVTEFRKGLAVDMGLNFHKVHKVNIDESTINLVVWLRLAWTDPRLRWSPKEYQNLTQTAFVIMDGSGPSGETSEIWSPDIELWNLEQSLTESFPDTSAVVDYTGRVFWSRPGHLLAGCKFDGLDDFPFDQLTCTMEFGSWAHSGKYLRPRKMDGEGYSIGGSETAGESFAEYSLGGVTVSERVYPPFPGDPESDWPVLLYQVTFQRAWQPYARGFIVVQVLLNLVAFGCFWLPAQTGERMSLAITAMLAAVASELTVSAKLPRTSEATWFSRFSLTSTMFASLVLLESAAVIYFHYHTGDDLVPGWYRSLQRAFGARGGEEEMNSKEEEEEVIFSSASEKLREVNKSWTDINHNISFNSPLEEVASEENSRPTVSFKLDNKPDNEMDVSITSHNDIHHQDPGITITDIHHADSHDDHHGDPEYRTSNYHKFHSNLTGSTRAGIKTVLGRDADDFKDVREMENNIRWQQVARSIDDVARVIFPIGYAVFLAFAFGH